MTLAVGRDGAAPSLRGRRAKRGDAANPRIAGQRRRGVLFKNRPRPSALDRHVAAARLLAMTALRPLGQQLTL
jgi:hypothetical protein